MVDQRAEPVGVFPRIDLPVGQRTGVVVAGAEPAVVEHETLGAKGGGLGGDVLEHRQLVVEIDRFPAIVMHRAAGGSGLGQFTIRSRRWRWKATAQPFSPDIGIGRVKRGRLELISGAGSPSRCHWHGRTGSGGARRAVPRPPSCARRTSRNGRHRPRPGHWWRRGRARSARGNASCPVRPGAVVAIAPARGPGRAGDLELAAPAAGEIDHLVGE